MFTEPESNNDEPFPVENESAPADGSMDAGEQALPEQETPAAGPDDQPSDLFTGEENDTSTDEREQEQAEEGEEPESPTELLSEIRETLVQEDQRETKKSGGLLAWLGGIFRRKEKVEPVELGRLETAETEPEINIEADEAPEMMGAFPLYRLQEPEYYDLDETSGPPETQMDDEEVVELPGQVFTEEISPEESTAFVPAAAEEPSQLDEPKTADTETGETTEDSPEWKILLSRILNKQEKESEPQLDDAGLEDRLQRSMSDDTAQAQGVEAWLASLREQEGEESAPTGPAIARDWLEEETIEGETVPVLEESPEPFRTDELTDLRGQILDMEEEPTASDETLPEPGWNEPEDQDEVPVDERLVAFKDPFMDQTRDFHPSGRFSDRLELTEEANQADEDDEEIPQTIFTTTHPEIFKPDMEEEADQPAELRNVALEDYEAPPSTGEVIHPEKADTALQRFAFWVSDRSRLERASLIAVFLVIFIGVVLLAALALRELVPMLNVSQAPPAVSATADLAGAPYPIRLIMTGGWPFDLGRGAVQNGQWDPQGSEWLEGTELRRVVGLRYNSQLEAVTASLKKGDEISLVMSNADTLLYKVDEIKTVPIGDTSIFTGTRPSLVIVLFDQQASDRMVIICNQ